MSNVDMVQDKLNKLNAEIKKASEDISATMSAYNRQINKYDRLKEEASPFETVEPDMNQEKLIQTARSVSKHLFNIGIKIEKLFEKHDMFDLWDNYLNGEQSIFNEVLSNTLSRKQTMAIRKSFDDNADFHNLAIRYLFLMDMLIKELSNPLQSDRDNLLNLSVNYALDKVYFILIKALNNAD